MALLQREGLLQSAWHRGTRVIDLTVTDIDEVYSVRAALERLDAGAERPTLLALDIEFHDEIYAAAGNRRLRHAWHALRSLARVAEDHVDSARRALVNDG